MFRMIILKIRYFKQFFVNFAMEDVSIMVLVKIIIISFFIHVNAPRLDTGHPFIMVISEDP